MIVTHQTINVSENGSDPWTVSESNGEVTAADQTVTVPSHDCIIYLDSDKNLMTAKRKESVDMHTRLGWYDADADDLTLIEFVE